MLNTSKKESTKLSSKKAKTNNGKQEKNRKKHFIKDAHIKRWREPSKELLESIREVENGETTTYDSIDEMMKDLRT